MKLVIAILDLVGAGIEMVITKNSGQSHWKIGRMTGDAGALPEYEVKTLMTPDYAALQVHSSGKDRAGIAQSSRKALTWDATRRLRFVVHAAG